MLFTRAVVLAGLRGTLFDFHFTSSSSESHRTLTAEASRGVHTHCALSTRGRFGALVDVCLTEGALVACVGAVAAVPIDLVLALSAILARQGRTLSDLDLTVDAGKSCGTFALVSSGSCRPRGTRPPILTRSEVAPFVTKIQFAFLSAVGQGAIAGEIHCGTLATSAIFAGKTPAGVRTIFRTSSLCFERTGIPLDVFALRCVGTQHDTETLL